MMTPNVTGQLLALHQAGKIRILSVNAPQRLKAAPNIPTTIEILPGSNMVAQLFTGLFAPAGTSTAIVNRVSKATRAALADASFQDKLVQSGFVPVLDSSPAKAQRFIDSERAQLLPVIKATGFKK